MKRAVWGFGVLFLAGCSAPDQKLPEEAVLERDRQKEAAREVVRKVASDGGEMSSFDVNDDRRRLWTMRWDSAALEYSQEDDTFGGTMRRVEGTLFRQGSQASRFEAGSAVTTRGTNVLRLRNGIKIVSSEFNAVLRADEAIYDADQELIKAVGNIRAEHAGFLLSGINEVWADTRLEVIATPQMFRQMRPEAPDATKASRPASEASPKAPRR